MKKTKAQIGNFFMIIPFTLAILIITIGIATMVFAFFGKDYDMRAVDAQLLANKLQDCLTQNQIDWSLKEENFSEMIYSVCNLNKKIIEEKFYIEIKKNNEETPKMRVKNTDLCQLSDKNLEYPVCTNAFFEIGSEKYTIIAGSAQKIQREQI